MVSLHHVSIYIFFFFLKFIVQKFLSLHGKIFDIGYELSEKGRNEKCEIFNNIRYCQRILKSTIPVHEIIPAQNGDDK